MTDEHTTTIYVKCLCGSLQTVTIFKRLLPSKTKPDKPNPALGGRGDCSVCGRELWVYDYVEVHPKGHSKENEEFVKKLMEDRKREKETCSICGLPREDHIPSKPGNVPRAGSCLFAP